MISYTDIEDSVFDIVNPVINPTNVQDRVIFARQADPAPSSKTEAYTTILVKNLTQIAREIVGKTDDNGVTPITVDYQIQIDFQSYGPGARDIIAQLRFAFSTPSIVLQFLDSGLALVGHPVVVDIPKVINTQWEEVSLLSATFNLSDTNDDDTGLIETVEDLDGDILDCAGNVVRQIELTVDSSTP
jgi:hypothetical protein